jgi:hypothetical protein
MQSGHYTQPRKSNFYIGTKINYRLFSKVQLMGYSEEIVHNF